jgi:hypothetical protein
MIRAVILAVSLMALSIGSASAKVRCTTPDDCKVHREGVHRKVIPTDDYVCVFFRQPKSQRVTLRLNFEDGKVRYYQNKRPDRICIGRHFVRNAIFMYICNDDAHADFVKAHVAIVAAKPAYSRKAEACLYGKDKCREMGYLTRD